jgi:hypothetical protein
MVLVDCKVKVKSCHGVEHQPENLRRIAITEHWIDFNGQAICIIDL